MIQESTKRKHVYLWKAMWRGTALSFRVTAVDEDEAFLKATRRVKRMQGGDSCLDLVLTRIIS